MQRNKRIYIVLLLLGVFILGIVTPFVPAIHVTVMFYLLIPMLFCFIFSLVFLLVGLIFKDKKTTKMFLFVLVVLVLFQSAQLLSVYSVDRFQKYRSKKLIDKLKLYKAEHHSYPDTLKNEFKIRGVKYILLENGEYILEFERGFFVREVFTSKDGTWRSYGWND